MPNRPKSWLAALSSAALILVTSCPATAQWKIVSDTLQASLRAVDIYADGFGLAVGFGVIYRTDDWGKTWSLSDTASVKNLSLRAVTIDSTIAGVVSVAVGSSQSIVRSADKGTSWRSVHSGVNSPFNGACSPASGKVTAFGNGGWLGASTDTGLSWQTGLIFPAADMSGFDCLPSGTLWVAGYANNGSSGQCCGVLLRSDNRGETFTKAFELTNTNDGHFRAISFASEDVGYAISTAGFVMPHSFLWKTEDGGGTWTKIGGFDEIHALDFANEDVGVMVGFEGLILWTDDGGVTWVEHPNPSPLPLYDVMMLDAKTAVAVGDAFIIRNETGAPVRAESFEVPQEALRTSAFPNPASDAVTISCDGGDVTSPRLALTDVLGRHIAVEATASIAGGAGSLRLNIQSLPPGVYFFNLRTTKAASSGSFVIGR